MNLFDQLSHNFSSMKKLLTNVIYIALAELVSLSVIVLVLCLSIFIFPAESINDHNSLDWLLTVFIFIGWKIFPVFLCWFSLKINQYRLIASYISIISFYSLKFLLINFAVRDEGFRMLLAGMFLPLLPTLLVQVFLVFLIGKFFVLWREKNPVIKIALITPIFMLIPAFYGVIFFGLGYFYPRYYNDIFEAVFIKQNLVFNDRYSTDSFDFSVYVLPEKSMFYSFAGWQLFLDADKLKTVNMVDYPSVDDWARAYKTLHINFSDELGDFQLMLTPNQSEDIFFAAPKVLDEIMTKLKIGAFFPEKFFQEKCYFATQYGANHSQYDYDTHDFYRQITLERVLKSDTFMEKLCLYQYAIGRKTLFGDEVDFINYHQPYVLMRSMYRGNDKKNQKYRAQIAVKSEDSGQYLTIDIARQYSAIAATAITDKNPWFYHDNAVVMNLLAQLKYRPLTPGQLQEKKNLLEYDLQKHSVDIATQLQSIELFVADAMNSEYQRLYQLAFPKK
jgi:hypothetical protein